MKMISHTKLMLCIGIILNFYIGTNGYGSEVDDISELQRIRVASMPLIITQDDRAYKLIQALGRSRTEKAAAAKELTNWMYVKEPDPQTFETFSQADIHPAARALIRLGQVSVPFLIDLLSNNLTSEQIKLVAKCVRSIQQDQASATLRATNIYNSSVEAKRAIEAVLDE